MQQYFIKGQVENPVIIKDKNTVKHMFNVMRLTVNKTSPMPNEYLGYQLIMIVKSLWAFKPFSLIFICKEKSC